MRKADYALLAAILRSQLDSARRQENYARQGGNPMTALGFEQQTHALEEVARRFAAEASVDRAAFLKACGIG